MKNIFLNETLRLKSLSNSVSLPVVISLPDATIIFHSSETEFLQGVFHRTSQRSATSFLRASILFQLGFSCSQVSKFTSIPLRTVYSWFKSQPRLAERKKVIIRNEAAFKAFSAIGNHKKSILKRSRKLGIPPATAYRWNKLLPHDSRRK